MKAKGIGKKMAINTNEIDKLIRDIETNMGQERAQLHLLYDLKLTSVKRDKMERSSISNDVSTSESKEYC